jgi:hypothetical protein
MNKLAKFWRAMPLLQPPYIHPADLPIFCAHPNLFDEGKSDFRRFIKGPRFGNFDDNKFHASLLPSPFGGDLNRAKIFILMLNPGFAFADYHKDKLSQRWKKRTLHQKLSRAEFPFTALNPELCYRPGFIWWEKKLRQVLKRIAKERFNGSYFEAMRSLSKNLAVIELVPYHSASFKGSKIIRELPSVEVAKQFVHDVLLPHARRGKATVIVTRKAKEWGLKEGRNVVVYGREHARGASLGARTLGGKAILKHYGIT